MNPFFAFGARGVLCFFGSLWLLLRPQTAAAQTWRWAVSNSPNTGQYNVTSTAADPAGNVFVTGTYNTATALGTHNLPPPQGDDGFVAMADSNGVWQWVVPLQGAGYNSLSSISLADPTALYVVGCAPGAATLGGATLPAGTDSTFVARLSRTGALQWAWRGPVQVMAATSTGNVYVATDFATDSIQVGPFLVRNAEALAPPGVIRGSDILLAELNAQGTCQWATAIGGKTSQFAPLLAVDPQNNLLLAGGFSSSQSDTVQISVGVQHFQQGGQNMSTGTPQFYAKMTPNRQWQWLQCGLGEDGTGVDALTTDADGAVYATGWFLASTLTLAGTTISSVGATGIYLLKLSGSGDLQWLIPTASPSSSSTFDAICVDAYKSVYLRANFSDDSLIFSGLTIVNPRIHTNGSPQRANSVLCLDSLGRGRWAVLDTALNGSRSPLTVDAARQVTIGSSYLGTATFGATTLPGPGGLFLAQLGTPAIIYHYAPRVGGPGTPVTLAGVGFRGTTQVLFGGVPATFTVLSDGQIQVAVPAGVPFNPQGVLIEVVGPGGTGQALGRFNLTPTGLRAAAVVSALVLTPNPAHGATIVRGGQPGAALSVSDALGRHCATARFAPDGTATLRLEALPAGVYLVRAEGAVARLVLE